MRIHTLTPWNKIQTQLAKIKMKKNKRKVAKVTRTMTELSQKRATIALLQTIAVLKLGLTKTADWIIIQRSRGLILEITCMLEEPRHPQGSSCRNLTWNRNRKKRSQHKSVTTTVLEHLSSTRTETLSRMKMQCLRKRSAKTSKLKKIWSEMWSKCRSPACSVEQTNRLRSIRKRIYSNSWQRTYQKECRQSWDLMVRLSIHLTCWGQA